MLDSITSITFEVEFTSEILGEPQEVCREVTMSRSGDQFTLNTLDIHCLNPAFARAVNKKIAEMNEKDHDTHYVALQ